MKEQLKVLLLLHRKKLSPDIPKDIRTLFLLETIISYRGIEEALIFIINTRRLNWIRYLVEERGADISYDNYLGFRIASGEGHLEVVKYLVERGAHIHSVDDYALRLASHNGHLEVVKYLVEQGANINSQDNYALRQAFVNRHFHVVMYLVEKGAYIHAQYDDWTFDLTFDWTFRWAAENGHLDLFKCLIKRDRYSC